jgi:hypothetical protein
VRFSCAASSLSPWLFRLPSTSPTESIGKTDNFIDDLIVTILGTQEH